MGQWKVLTVDMLSVLSCVQYTHKEKNVMGVGTKAMGDSKCYDSLQAGKLHVHV